MAIIALDKDITQVSAEDFRQQLLALRQKLSDDEVIEMDWSEVGMIDSTGLAVLLTFAQQVTREVSGVTLRLTGVQPQIHRLLQMVRLHKLVPLTIEEYRHAG